MIERADRARPEADPRFVSLVRAAQVRHLYAAQMVGLPGNVAGVVLAVRAAGDRGADGQRHALGRLRRRRVRRPRSRSASPSSGRPTHAEDLTRWEHRYLATSFASGVIWALYGTFLFPYGGPNHETAGVIIMVGLAAGGVSTLSASRRAYLLYMLPTLLPLLVYFATGTGTSHWVLFTGVLVYIVFLAGASRNMHESIVEGFQRRFALDALVADLTQAQETDQRGERAPLAGADRADGDPRSGDRRASPRCARASSRSATPGCTSCWATRRRRC